MKTTGNTILITGGGSGIGRALAEAFHRKGNQVIIAGRRQNALDEVVRANPGMIGRTLDIGSAEAISAFSRTAISEFPALNGVIHSAGIMRNENLFEVDHQTIDETVVTNLLGTLRLTAALLPHFRAQAHSTIMTVSSGLAFLPLAMTPTYCATKAAIHSYTQSLRYQLRDTTTQVLELAPPYVQTELMGERQASDPHAMPLADFIAEVMHIIETRPDAAEILVERVKPLRFAEKGENYPAFFKQFNDGMLAARANES